MNVKKTLKMVQIVVAVGQVVLGPKARLLGLAGQLIEVSAEWLLKNPHVGKPAEPKPSAKAEKQAAPAPVPVAE